MIKVYIVLTYWQKNIKCIFSLFAQYVLGNFKSLDKTSFNSSIIYFVHKKSLSAAGMLIKGQITEVIIICSSQDVLTTR